MIPYRPAVLPHWVNTAHTAQRYMPELMVLIDTSTTRNSHERSTCTSRAAAAAAAAGGACGPLRTQSLIWGPSQNSVAFPTTILITFWPYGMYEATYQTRAHHSAEGGRTREGQIGAGHEGARRAERSATGRGRERACVRSVAPSLRARKRQLMITTMPGACVKASESVTIIATM